MQVIVRKGCSKTYKVIGFDGRKPIVQKNIDCTVKNPPPGGGKRWRPKCRTDISQVVGDACVDFCSDLITPDPNTGYGPPDATAIGSFIACLTICEAGRLVQKIFGR